MTTYHLWLMPTGKVYDRLAQLIRELSERYGGPRFEPHVTLLGEIQGNEEEVCRKTTRLAQALYPFNIQLSSPGHQDHYFRCMYLNVKHAPPIREANVQARSIFNRDDSSPFHPHLSLLYGLYREETKERIIALLPSELDQGFTVDAISLIRAEREMPQDWYRLKTFPLTGA